MINLCTFHLHTSNISSQGALMKIIANVILFTIVSLHVMAIIVFIAGPINLCQLFFDTKLQRRG